MSAQPKQAHHPHNKAGGSTLVTALIILFVLSAAVVITVIVFGPKNIEKKFFARSIGGAADSCEEKINDYFGDRLVSKYYDEISSRHDSSRKQYTIYYRISHSTSTDGRPGIENSMAKCVVWESLGYVSDFRVFKP